MKEDLKKALAALETELAIAAAEYMAERTRRAVEHAEVRHRFWIRCLDRVTKPAPAPPAAAPTPAQTEPPRPEHVCVPAQELSRFVTSLDVGHEFHAFTVSFAPPDSSSDFVVTLDDDAAADRCAEALRGLELEWFYAKADGHQVLVRLTEGCTFCPVLMQQRCILEDRFESDLRNAEVEMQHHKHDEFDFLREFIVNHFPYELEDPTTHRELSLRTVVQKLLLELKAQRTQSKGPDL